MPLVSNELPQTHAEELRATSGNGEQAPKACWGKPQFESFPLNGALGIGNLFRARDFVPHFGVS